MCLVIFEAESRARLDEVCAALKADLETQLSELQEILQEEMDQKTSEVASQLAEKSKEIEKSVGERVVFKTEERFPLFFWFPLSLLFGDLCLT